LFKLVIMSTAYGGH